MKHKQAQAAIELAVFGAILIFILGTIVRSAVSNGYAQNQNFKAMRMAMLNSWNGSKAHPGKGAAQDISHNSASVLFVEDRLSPDFNKYGDLDRNPFIAQGSGTFSYNLNYPVDTAEVGANLAVMDVYINGQHFPFTTASYTTKTITQPVCSSENGSLTQEQQCLLNQCLRNQREWSGNNKIFYTRVPNANAPVSDGTLSFTFDPNASDSTVDPPFDLLRNNDPATYVPSNLRPYMAWQWATATATSASSIGLNPSNNQYPTFDIDGRLKEVIIYVISLNSDGTPTVSYEDIDGGDIDAGWDSNSCGPKPGLLQNDAQIYTFTQNAQNGTNGGTYLQIKEGKLYNPETDRYVRSQNKRDTIDLIQRMIQLSNNTGRFCPSGQSETPFPCVANASSCPNDPNPVEVCIYLGDSNNCFNSETNIKSTCYDENDNIIFVRSRLEDRRGHFWMTDTSGQLQVQ